jgi:hypothetical protein
LSQVATRETEVTPPEKYPAAYEAAPDKSLLMEERFAVVAAALTFVANVNFSIVVLLALPHTKAHESPDAAAPSEVRVVSALVMAAVDSVENVSISVVETPTPEFPPMKKPVEVDCAPDPFLLATDRSAVVWAATVSEEKVNL